MSREKRPPEGPIFSFGAHSVLPRAPASGCHVRCARRAQSRRPRSAIGMRRSSRRPRPRGPCSSRACASALRAPQSRDSPHGAPAGLLVDDEGKVIRAECDVTDRAPAARACRARLPSTIRSVLGFWHHESVSAGGASSRTSRRSEAMLRTSCVIGLLLKPPLEATNLLGCPLLHLRPTPRCESGEAAPQRRPEPRGTCREGNPAPGALREPAIVEQLRLVRDDEGRDGVAQALLEHDEPAHAAVAVLEGVDGLELCVEGHDVLERPSRLDSGGREE